MGKLYSKRIDDMIGHSRRRACQFFGSNCRRYSTQIDKRYGSLNSFIGAPRKPHRLCGCLGRLRRRSRLRAQMGPICKGGTAAAHFNGVDFTKYSTKSCARMSTTNCAGLTAHGLPVAYQVRGGAGAVDRRPGAGRRHGRIPAPDVIQRGKGRRSWRCKPSSGATKPIRWRPACSITAKR